MSSSPLSKERAKEALARKYGIDGDFILYLGRLQGRKNLMRLVNAYAHTRKRDALTSWCSRENRTLCFNRFWPESAN